jgi:hypothetical protein
MKLLKECGDNTNDDQNPNPEKQPPKKPKSPSPPPVELTIEELGLIYKNMNILFPLSKTRIGLIIHPDYLIDSLKNQARLYKNIQKITIGIFYILYKNAPEVGYEKHQFNTMIDRYVDEYLQKQGKPQTKPKAPSPPKKPRVPSPPKKPKEQSPPLIELTIEELLLIYKNMDVRFPLSKRKIGLYVHPDKFKEPLKNQARLYKNVKEFTNGVFNILYTNVPIDGYDKHKYNTMIDLFADEYIRKQGKPQTKPKAPSPPKKPKEPSPPKKPKAPSPPKKPKEQAPPLIELTIEELRLFYKNMDIRFPLSQEDIGFHVHPEFKEPLKTQARLYKNVREFTNGVFIFLYAKAPKNGYDKHKYNTMIDLFADEYIRKKGKP